MEKKIYRKFHSNNNSNNVIAHADPSELMEWIKKYENHPQQIMLVHGELSALEALRVKIQTELEIPVTTMIKDQEVVLSEAYIPSDSLK